MSHPLLTEDNKLLIPNSLLILLWGQLSLNFNYSNRTAEQYIGSFIDKEAEAGNELFIRYKHSKISYTQSTLERILQTIKGRKSSKKYYLPLDLLSQICFSQSLARFALTYKAWPGTNSYSVNIPEEYKAEIDEIVFNQLTKTNIPGQLAELKETFKTTVATQQDFVFENVEYITTEYFGNLIINDNSLREKDIVQFYLNFNSKWNTIKKIVANKLHIAPENNFIITTRGQQENLSIEDLIHRAQIGAPIFIKVLSVGGVGKSTLLWHLMRELSFTSLVFYLQRVSNRIIDQIVSTSTNDHRKDDTLIFFIDDIVSAENKPALSLFGESIAKHGNVKKIVLIAAERLYRYDKFNGRGDFESNFGENIYTIRYTTSNIKEKVFEKVLWALNKEHILNDPAKRDHYYRHFEPYKLESLVDNTFSLLVYLKQENKDIKFEFDWVDWEKHCVGDFKDFSTLFKAVAFFHQFGIRIPMDFVKTYYNNMHDAEHFLSTLLGYFDDPYSPIIQTETEKDKFVLSLRHEKLGEWYFKVVKNGEKLARAFLTNFLNNVKSRPYSYLFRNISRNNPDFIKSPYLDLLPNNKILNIINNYIRFIPESEYTDEEFKMLMDRHFILLNMNRDDEAIQTLERIIAIKEPVNVDACIRARTRLSYCIKETDPNRAILLLKEVLKSHPTNTYAQFGLLEMYYYNDPDEFRNYQKELFEKSIQDIIYAKKLVTFISETFDKITNITDNLYTLYSVHKELGINIASLLVRKRSARAYDFLMLLTENIDTEAKKTVMPLLIKTVETHLLDKSKSQAFIQKLQTLVTSNQIEPSYSNYIRARLLCIQDNPDFEEAEVLFEAAFKTDKKGRIFFSITKFYRDYSAYIHDSNTRNLVAAIEILRRGLAFIDKRLSEFEKIKPPYRIEQCLFYNEIIKLIRYGFYRTDEGIQQYRQMIPQFEADCERTLDDVIESLYSELPQVSEQQSGNFAPDPITVTYFSKATSYLCKLYIGKLKTQDDTLTFKPDEQYGINLLAKSIASLKNALRYDNDNAFLLLSLIECEILLAENNIDELLNDIDFQKFKPEQKARLCLLLFKKERPLIGKRLTHQFGFLHTTDLRVINNLIFCYIEAEEWAFAIKISSTIKRHTVYSLYLLKRLAFEMPIISYERATDCLRLLELYVTQSDKDLTTAYKKIILIYYLIYNMEDCRNFYYKNATYFNYIENKKESLEDSFNRLIEEFTPNMVDFLTCLTTDAEVLAYKTNIYSESLKLAEQIINKVLSLKLNFLKIEYNFKNINEVDEKIKAIVIKVLKIHFYIIDIKIPISESAYKQMFSLIIDNENPLLHKVFLHKLGRSESEYLIRTCVPIFNYLKKSFYTEPDIVRMSGRCYLSIKDFHNSKNSFSKCLTMPSNKKQLCYAHNNMADWIVSKIEYEGPGSFSDMRLIKSNIIEAGKHIDKSRKLFDSIIKFQTSLVERYNALRVKYDLNY